MTDEEIEEELKGVVEAIKALPEKEKKRRKVLELQQKILEDWKEAREEKNEGRELSLSTCYGILKRWGEKHPILAMIAIARVKFALSIRSAI